MEGRGHSYVLFHDVKVLAFQKATAQVVIQHKPKFYRSVCKIFRKISHSINLHKINFFCFMQGSKQFIGAQFLQDASNARIRLANNSTNILKQLN